MDARIYKIYCVVVGRLNMEKLGLLTIALTSNQIWLLLMVVSLLFIVGQLFIIRVAKAKNWTIRIRPIQIILFIILFFISLYSLITGKQF